MNLHLYTDSNGCHKPLNVYSLPTLCIGFITYHQRDALLTVTTEISFNVFYIQTPLIPDPSTCAV
jgi:hypothetical protein